ncbi:MAG: polysaccharide biosynthesis/export family protein [Bacteroidetes bacterium]|nr:polysaccharide biosynthesis/export family protein [Bacteroidota bacterium]
MKQFLINFKLLKKGVLLFITVLSIVSCATKKEIVYFQDSENLHLKEIEQSFVPIIEYNDILHITISSVDDEVVKPFQRSTGVNSNNMNNTKPGYQGYLVNSEGEIQFPVLGTIAVSGKTRGQVEKELKAKLSDYIKDVVVDVRIMNFKITVLGGVNNPGVFTIDDERVTIPEAIGLAGDISEDGKRENITIIREENGKSIVTKIDFTKTDLFSSPFYFLKQNDIVYVEPSKKGVKKSGFIPDIPALLSLFTVILSTVILLTN